MTLRLTAAGTMEAAKGLPSAEGLRAQSEVKHAIKNRLEENRGAA
jgi:hypothetical protein